MMEKIFFLINHVTNTQIFASIKPMGKTNDIKTT